MVTLQPKKSGEDKHGNPYTSYTLAIPPSIVKQLRLDELDLHINIVDGKLVIIPLGRKDAKKKKGKNKG